MRKKFRESFKNNRYTTPGKSDDVTVLFCTDRYMAPEKKGDDTVLNKNHCEKQPGLREIADNAAH